MLAAGKMLSLQSGTVRLRPPEPVTEGNRTARGAQLPVPEGTAASSAKSDARTCRAAAQGPVADQVADTSPNIPCVRPGSWRCLGWQRMAACGPACEVGALNAGGEGRQRTVITATGNFRSVLFS